ncbi:MAG: AMP-binding protein [Oscillospiraceae bacterium]|nr:AMP-binding protein [Oscillospiraceae bacterium]
MAKAITGLDFKIQEMAGRIHELREISGYTTLEMAQKTGVSEEEYIACESGESDLHFAFLYRCALAFSVDVTDLIEGKSPKLRSYTLTRSGAGQKIEQAHEMIYYNMASNFQNRIADPLYVENKYSDRAFHSDIELTTHDGQECDLIIKGSMKVQIGEHTEILHEGDCIYFDSSIPHGMVAADGQDCTFYAIVLRAGEELAPAKTSIQKISSDKAEKKDVSGMLHIADRFIDTVEDENGLLKKISFHDEEKFNFAFDIVDAFGTERPDKLAMLHIDEDGTERRFTFKDIKDMSARAANYFTSIGIKRGDRVMLVLKRHYQFWFAMMALNKIGAIAIPATNQLLQHDFAYRFKAANVAAILCTGDGITAAEADKAEAENGMNLIKIMVHGKRDGWRDFDEEVAMFSHRYARKDDAPCGSDPMLMYFTSGTSGYPKLTAHNYKYPLGHYCTAKYWHRVDPNGLHLTISDTGWAKAMWGKLYGQWLAEAAVFVYDFDRFDAEKILPMFAKYQITTFCAPPTMYRMLIKQDISQYDLSSIKHATSAGEALNPEVTRVFEQNTGLQIMEAFGQTESTAIIANIIGDTHKMGSMGKPVPLYDVHLLDREGNEVPTGDTGEICINISNGLPCGLAFEYTGNPEVTAETWRDGFYHTGDLAWCDEDGFFWYVGRADDVIKSSGYRIGPFEIESTIMELPYVLECGVSAAPDPVRGQVVKASIVLVKGTEGTEALKKEIQEYVKIHTAPYKYPRIVVFKDELPKTVSGKIIRNKL